MAFFWFLTMLCAIASGFALVHAVLLSSGAPQQAAGAAIAIGMAVIPYVFTRCLHEMDRGNWQKHMLKALDRIADKSDV